MEHLIRLTVKQKWIKHSISNKERVDIIEEGTETIEYDYICIYSYIEDLYQKRRSYYGL